MGAGGEMGWGRTRATEACGLEAREVAFVSSPGKAALRAASRGGAGSAASAGPAGSPGVPACLCARASS